ncbi:heparan-alpha-glucosaminide N-acetyltransferase domain-containing protein [Pedobacter sp. JY14-1]|uniref:acyltransferase family protein n=1 Tax=Pedobacter sp. JY14-1 TaxID=3034151 RepID=UPI0023E17C33|nr:heparan-alpha-glucosaminide N-acetyltransferase domain-containing protein [Pedobacter sp. JY14-1]
MDQPQRFLSLDVFRGMTICFMIIVNTPGSGAEPFSILQHAAWHGFTPTDLVFPSFLFAVGNAMSFSMDKFSRMRNSEVLYRIFKRTLLIFLIGYLMYWFPFFRYGADGHPVLSPIANTRILGVLQRIALCYGIASLLIHYLSSRTVFVLSIAFLAGYWLLLLLFGDPADPFSMTGNAGQYLDLFLFGEKHLYHGEGIAFDPEGLLSTIPACVNVIIGYYAGQFIRQKGKGFETIAKLLLAGGTLILLAMCLGPVFPINKKLWTSTFVLLTCGLDLVIIGALIYVVEVLGYVKWTRFFTILGKNPLFIYLVSEVLVICTYTIFADADLFGRVNRGFFQVIAPGPAGSLLFAVTFMLVCWLVAYFLDKRKIYIRV